MAFIKEKTYTPSILSETPAFVLLIIGLLSSCNNDLSSSFLSNGIISFSNLKDTIRKFSAAEDPKDYLTCPLCIPAALNGFSNDSDLNVIVCQSEFFNSGRIIPMAKKQKNVQISLMNKV